MRIKVILNPWSDRGRAARYADPIKQWGALYGQNHLDLIATDAPGEARELAQEAAEAGYEMVVAAGGDGTVHEILNGLVRGGKAQAKLGVIPIGSGNDFAAGLGLPADPKTAMQRLLTGAPRPLDLARIEDDQGRFAIVANGLGIGFDATISIETRNITRIHGFGMYLLATLRTIAFYYQTPRMEIQFDDESVNQEALFLSIGVGPRIGGGFHLTPDAQWDDNLLDSCLVNPVGRLTMLWMLPRAMKGTHTDSPHVTMRRSRLIDIKSDRPMPIHADGEIFAHPEDNVRRVTVVSLPAAVEIMS